MYINSGLSLMHATILRRMRITPQYLVWLEGLYITNVYYLANHNVYFQYTVGIATLSRQDHRVAQTRELACTKMVLPQVIARGLPVDIFIFLFNFFYL